ncbi:DUF4097 family beta strand repeat protein [Solibacillus sp. A46]|uniref:DUF4097 family beta strand repeat protein n=1 Tax=Solibacillus faecavium TaxID=2762221 RepID=A0ABR8XUS3_9BACL|nr:DUF4097 family beta strand repeat-containing protein [Solibacillus faecavium]MBD8035684.1 DUF4097 family beta strand repeat protein [Solibacillus faecavium]
MQEERKRILQLVENGTISAEEAIVLFEKLSSQKESTPQPVVPTFEKQKEEPHKADPIFEEQKQKRKTTGFEDIFGKSFNDKEFTKKMDEFMGDIKQDLSQFSTRMTGMVGAALSKFKDLDIETPFGEKVEFTKTFAYPISDIKSIELEVANGKVDVVRATDELVTVNIFGKTPQKGTQEETISQVTENLSTLTNDKLFIQSANKFTQLNVQLAIPEKHYDVFIARLLTGSISIEQMDAKLIKARTYNGIVRLENVTFDHAELQASNGTVEARHVKGDDLEVETANGRIYIDGELKEVEAESVNGHVVITTTSSEAHKIKARALAGSVEIYVPKTVALEGQIFTNFGKADVGLNDVKLSEEEEQFLSKSLRFTKELEGAKLLKLVGESRTGTVLVRYTLQ